MKTIHKQVLPMLNENKTECVITVPKGSLHIDAQLQRNCITIWYICDPEEEEVQMLFEIVGTGWPLEDDFVSTHYWLKTFQNNGYVWHLFLKDLEK